MNRKKLETAYLDISIPQNAENLSLPDPSLLNHYVDLENRTLWIDGEIDDYSVEYAKYIMHWNKEDKELEIDKREPIKLLFFSVGGDLTVNNLLVDTITMSKTRVIGVNCGLAASAGCFIYLSCHERYTFPTAKFLLHQGAGRFEGTYDQVVAAVIDYQEEIEALGNFVLDRTNIPQEDFDANFSTDWYINAEEALDYGMCEKIVESLDEIL